VQPGDLTGLLKSTAADIGPTGRDDFFGDGLLDAQLALAAAGLSDSGTPKLHASSKKLTYDVQETHAEVLITNEGPGTITGVNFDPGLVLDPWLSVSLDGTQTPTKLTATVSRAGLSDGVYHEEIDLVSDLAPPEGNLAIRVELDVSTKDPSSFGNMVVLLSDVETGEVASQFIATADSKGTFPFSFVGVPAGKYYLIAGTDNDGDFVLGDADGELFGVYPLTTQPQQLDVQDGTQFKDLVLQVETVTGSPLKSDQKGNPTGRYRAGSFGQR
jgi:serine protease